MQIYEESGKLSVLDIIILLCIIPFVVNGLIKGFTAQLAAVVSIVAGVWLSSVFTEKICTWAGPYINFSERILKVAVFIAIMVAAILFFRILGKALRKVVKIAMLGWADRLLGALFGLVAALLVVSVVIIVFDNLNGVFAFTDGNAPGKSVLYGPIKEFAYKAIPCFREFLAK